MPGRPRSRGAAGLPAVTPDCIIDAALELTARHGLETWTLRQLAGAVDVYPAVIYHHVGDRDTVVTAVVDRVLAKYQLPEMDLPWWDWWRSFLTNLRDVFLQYPGVARRVALNGPGTEAGGPTLNVAMRTLLGAGFEQDEAALVCRLLIIQACLVISMEDDQRMASKSVPDQLRTPEQNQEYFGELFDYAVDRILNGVEQRLHEVREQR